MSEQIVQPRIQKEITRMPVTLDNLHVSNFQKEGTITAQLRQQVKTLSKYPSKQISNNMSANIFSIEEFGFGTQDFETIENRMFFMDTPVGATEDAVRAKLAALPEACIYKVMDNKPIVTESQEYAINNPDLNVTMASIANSQVVRYPDNHAEKPGQLILDPNGKVQYRATFFWPTFKEDVDDRKAEADYGYVSPELRQELAAMSATPAVSGANVQPQQSL